MNLHEAVEYISKFLKNKYEAGDMKEYDRLVILLRDILNDYISKIDK